jgi:ribosomal protein S18 acetylase RimI-like enzyme
MASSLWTRGRAVGCVAVDPSGSIPLVVVAPAHQRRGIGTDLLSAALARLSACGVGVAHAGSGGTDYIWPGVPMDLSAAARFLQPAAGMPTMTPWTWLLTYAITARPRPPPT